MTFFSSPCVCGSRASNALSSLHGTEDDVELKSSENFRCFSVVLTKVFALFSLWDKRVLTNGDIAVCVYVRLYAQDHEWKRRRDITVVAFTASLSFVLFFCWIHSDGQRRAEGRKLYIGLLVVVSRWFLDGNALRELFPPALESAHGWANECEAKKRAMMEILHVSTWTCSSNLILALGRSLSLTFLLSPWDSILC